MDNNSNNSYQKNLTKFLSNDKQQTMKQNLIRKSPINLNNHLYIPNNGRNYFINIKERLKKDRSIQAADKKLSLTNQEIVYPENYPELNYNKPPSKEINLNDISNVNSHPKEIINKINYNDEHAITNYVTADTYLNRRHLQEVERINKIRKQKEKKELENKHIPVISKNSQKIVKNLLEKERYSNRNYSNSTYTSNANANNKGDYNINNCNYPPKCPYSVNNNRMINEQKMLKTPIGKESISKNAKCSSIKKSKCSKFIKDDYKVWLDKNYKKNNNNKVNNNSSRYNNLKNQDSIYNTNTNSKCNILNDELLMDNKTPKYDRYTCNDNDNDDTDININNNKDGEKRYNTNFKKEISYNFKDLFNHDTITNNINSNINTNTNKEKINDTPLKNYPGTNINTEHKDINNYNNYNNINYQSTNLIINNNPIISSINQNIGNNDNNQFVNKYSKINLKDIRCNINNVNNEDNVNNVNNENYEDNNRYQSAANNNDDNEKHYPYLNSGEQNFLIQKVSNYLNSKNKTNNSQNFQLDLDSREFALERLKDLKNRLNYNTNTNSNNANNNNNNYYNYNSNSNIKKSNSIANNKFINQNVINNKNKYNYYK